MWFVRALNIVRLYIKINNKLHRSQSYQIVLLFLNFLLSTLDLSLSFIKISYFCCTNSILYVFVCLFPAGETPQQLKGLAFRPQHSRSFSERERTPVLGIRCSFWPPHMFAYLHLHLSTATHMHTGAQIDWKLGIKLWRLLLVASFKKLKNHRRDKSVRPHQG